ncbi:MAG: FAD-dependent oxidoreductase, partial [Clostridia bacterium]
MNVTIIGGGLAGCEAAWQLASRGVTVELYEMKPNQKNPAQQLSTMAELVCSNSLRSDRLSNAVGLLKAEMRKLGSLIMHVADDTAVPAGGALAVDRVSFSQQIDAAIRNHPQISVHDEEICEIPAQGTVVIATGPIVTADSLDMSKVFRMSRYERGEDYLNCPMTREEYMAFTHALQTAETVEIHGFEEKAVFEGCMPIESMAKRGDLSIAFGPLKPV